MTMGYGGPTEPPTDTAPGAPGFEPAPTPLISSAVETGAVAPAPVQPVTATRGRRPSVRWMVAVVVVALVVATASAAFIAVAGAGAPSTVASWAPADTTLYAEARFDLPGDQRTKLAEFLSAFPGFADQASLDQKLAELYDRLVHDASSKTDYSTDIAPWFGGQLAVAAPAPTSLSKATPMGNRHMALLATVTDATKAQAWLASLGSGGTSAVYGGVTLTVVSKSGDQYAYGIDGPILVAGDIDSVHAVIDTKGSSGLASTKDYHDALAAFQGDHLAFFFVDTGNLVAALPKSGSAGGCGAAAVSGLTWSATAVRAESDHLVADAALPALPGASSEKDSLSTLAPRLPASTIAVFEQHDLGSTIQAFVARAQKDPACASALKSVTDTLDKVGGLDSFLSWVGDSAVAVTKDGDTYGGGIVIALPDAAAADTAAGKFASLKNLAALSGAAKVTTEDHGGATITTISLNDVSSLLPSSDQGAADALRSVDASISYTISNGLVVVGVGGDGFVKAVLDTKAGSSLADQARYKTALDRAGAENVASAYVDIHAIVGAVEEYIPASDKTSFDTGTKPYLEPLEAVAASHQAGDIMHARFVLTVSK
jgi:hypothetical protein